MAFLLALSGCATVHHGPSQAIAVSSVPAGADVEVRCGKAKGEGKTPTTVRLPRRADPCSLELTLEGYQPETVVFDTHPSRWAWGNFGPVIAGGVSGATRHSDQAFVDFLIGALFSGIGFSVDAISGSMWELEPAVVERDLTPTNSP
jgi:hypothetical protein